MGKLYDIVGKRFGKLIVLYRVPNRNTRQSRWVCQCDCGNKKEVLGHCLIQNHTKSCGCLVKELPSYNYKGVGCLGKKRWAGIKRHAKDRNLIFEITIEDAWNKFLEQNRICALTGEVLILERDVNKSLTNTASLDRIDSSKGYTVDNVQWVHKDVNIIKSNLSEDRLLFWVKKIYENSLRQT